MGLGKIGEIMILDLARLSRKGKTEETFYFEYEPEGLDVGIPDAELVFPVKIEGKVTVTGEGSAVIEGDTVFTVKGNCTRCLSPVTRTFVASFNELCDDRADGPYRVINDKIDLAGIVDETIILNIPVSFLCKEDCKGICLSCGKNLNDGDCKCIKEGK